MKITRTSQLSGKTHTLDIDISEEQLTRVENRRSSGELIQNIIPHIPKVREGVSDVWNNTRRMEFCLSNRG
jgi:hypothetical protein